MTKQWFKCQQWTAMGQFLAGHSKNKLDSLYLSNYIVTLTYLPNYMSQYPSTKLHSDGSHIPNSYHISDHNCNTYCHENLKFHEVTHIYNTFSNRGQFSSLCKCDTHNCKNVTKCVLRLSRLPKVVKQQVVKEYTIWYTWTLKQLSCHHY
jgi:hypothetical protein